MFALRVGVCLDLWFLLPGSVVGCGFGYLVAVLFAWSV